MAIVAVILLVGLWGFFKDHLQRRSQRLNEVDPDAARGIREVAGQVEKGRRAANLGWPTE